MTNKQGFIMIGERADALAKDSNVQKKMMEIQAREGKEPAIRFLYLLAVSTLCGV